MARVLLISANTTTEPYPVYPLGVSMLANALRRDKHEVHIFDLLASVHDESSLTACLTKFTPSVIGISLRNIDNVDFTDTVAYADQYLALVRELRTKSDAPIVLGGAGFSLLPEAFMEFLGADYGVVGEGEQVFPLLVQRIVEGQRSDHRIIRGGCGLAGEALEPVHRDAKLLTYYLRHGDMLSVQSKRGCPHRCAYCTYPLLEGAAYRFRSPVVVVDEIQTLIREHSASYFAFTDSVFNDTRGHYLQVAEELVRRKNETPWMAFFRPAKFSKEEIDLLKRSGLRAAEFGTDASTDRTLASMYKDFSWLEVEHSNRLFGEAGVACAHFIIFGGPEETEATLREGLENIQQLETCIVFAFVGIRILPNTGIHSLAIEQGFVRPDNDLLTPVFYHSPMVSRKTVDETIRASFRTRRDRVYPPGRNAEQASLLYRMGHVGPLWNMLLRSKVPSTQHTK